MTSMTILGWLGFLLAIYALLFVVVILRGRERYWQYEFGFLYSRIEQRDRFLGIIFAPAYVVAHRLGVQRLSHPLKTL